MDDEDSASRYNAALYTAIESFSGLFVCAAGNETLNIDETPVYPASYQLPNLISVGASRDDDGRVNSSKFQILSP